ncbi:MAG: ankyrin repeat domain-containing protein [Treponema sp.]|jgi:hypothetical protein|nr:ankyrin repeat domain-containing protein [Treponema sp.]
MKEIIRLVRKPNGFLPSLAFFRAKALQKCGFLRKLFGKLKFPNNSIVILALFLCGTLFADDYRWNFIQALGRNDFLAIENILKENNNKILEAEKRLLMNLTINHSFGENAVRVLNILERYNIRPNAYDLYTAINRNQPNILIQSMVERGAEPNGEILLLTMEKQRFDLARLFIGSGADVNYHYPLSSSYADGMTPLLYAAKWGNFDLVKILVGYGALVNVRDINGSTALSMVRANGNSQIYDFLLEHGAVDTGNITEVPQASAGISGVLQTRALQAGTYRLFGSSTDIRFSGNADSGTISYIREGITQNGSYKIDGSNLILTLSGQIFAYMIVTNTSFSGNGELWLRMGN